ncbi:MAG: DUF1846 domain-containing protein [Verrucomicrobiae bacterium]|nr:DUF1846 domain-containing protein [Verrucomicrobiae bacterium]
MSSKIGFDNKKYLEAQTSAILERMARFGNKLYLEFGGKLLFDYHASRVLPGFDPNVKMSLLQGLQEKADIILCIYAGDIERKKVRADFGITYDSDAFKLIDDLRTRGIAVTAVVITRFEGQSAAELFKNKLERRGIRVYTHRSTRGYPTDVDLIASDEGYGANPYIETTRPLVVVTGPGPGSGKLATCLSQLYHEHKRGVRAGYSKFETFPIWNLPLKHPVNVAYEAATIDLKDVNMVDPFHLDACNERAINYNRDVEAFPLLVKILKRIAGDAAIYRSPTEMGVNRAGFAIIDDAIVQEAARQEIIRRYFRQRCEYAIGLAGHDSEQHADLLMTEVGVKPGDRRVVEPARRAGRDAQARGKGHEGIFCGAALELADGSLILGRNSPLMHAASSVVLNAVKKLAQLPEKIPLLAATTLESIASMKKHVLGVKTVSLNLEETLIALSVSAMANPSAQLATEKLKELRDCEMHITHMPTPGDEAGLRRLGVNLTSDPNFSTHDLFTS